MKASTPGSSTTQQHTESFMGRVNAYALAAGAAGVSLMALAQPADAEIVFTPANGTIPVNKILSLDINHDGTADFQFFLSTFAYHTFNASLNVTPLGGGGVVAAPPADAYAAALFRGNSIGPSRSFAGLRADLLRSHGTDLYSSIYHRSIQGLWSNVSNRYLGVRFTLGGATHYGWIRITVSDTRRPIKATITGYAYETIANQPIKAGQFSDQASAPAALGPIPTPTLGTLALGSHGLQMWRRDDSLLSVQ